MQSDLLNKLFRFIQLVPVVYDLQNLIFTIIIYSILFTIPLQTTNYNTFTLH